jgi:hypothetical protein
MSPCSLQQCHLRSRAPRPSTCAGYAGNAAQLTFSQPQQTNPATSSRSVACGQTGVATAEVNISNLGQPWTSLVNLTPHDRLLTAYERRSMAVVRQLQEPQSCGGLHHGRRTQQLALQPGSARPIRKQLGSQRQAGAQRPAWRHPAAGSCADSAGSKATSGRRQRHSLGTAETLSPAGPGCPGS